MDIEQRDLLISRVVDRCESAADWDALSELEREHREVWRELAQALRCDAELRSVMASEIARADQVEILPEISTPELATPVHRLAAWSGWITAAACLLAWLLSSPSVALKTISPEARTDNIAQVDEEATPVTITSMEPSEPVAIETEASSVITELPMVVVGTKPAENGDGYEVVYLRRVLETRRVDQIVELTADDRGDFRPVPVDNARLNHPEVF